MGVPRMGDDRDAAGPEARILVGAGNLATELRREGAVHGGNVDAGLLEDAAAQHAHLAAAAGRAGMVGALPRLQREARRRRRDRIEGAGAPRARASRARRTMRSRRVSNHCAAAPLAGSRLVMSFCPDGLVSRDKSRPVRNCNAARGSRGRGSAHDRRQAAGLPQRLAEHHGGRHRDIERAKPRPHRHDEARVGRRVHLVRHAGALAAEAAACRRARRRRRRSSTAHWWWQERAGRRAAGAPPRRRPTRRAARCPPASR